MTKLSMIVWTAAYDESLLARTLESVAQQSLPKSQWELLVLSPKAKSAPDWHPYSRGIVDEWRDATTLKRIICQASGQVSILLQAGAVPDPSYLSQALTITNKWPRLGVWGSGAIDLEFQTNASQPVRDLASQVARRNADGHLYSNVLTCVEAMPLGPGVCVRADVAAAYCERPPRVLKPDRTDSDIFALDLAAAELGYVACSMGAGMGIFPQLKLKRIIPDSIGERQLLDYRKRESILRALLNRDWKNIRPVDPLTPAALVSTARTILLESGVQRRLRVAEFKAAMTARKMLHEASARPAR